ncbi:MAG: type II toxin-antitoxin system RelE/ParE family toxin [Xanthomonadales bacterium]|nr:type II toxin-antitoxin system RelE/ParE family toxin [Xanthomonadales bacterium]
MTAKPIILLPAAERDVDEAMEYYRHEGGAVLASRWSHAVEVALRHIAVHPASGSIRYVELLKLPNLRYWSVQHFPYLVFSLSERRVLTCGVCCTAAAISRTR